MTQGRSVLTAAAVLFTAAFTSAHHDPPRKWAVLVGVADYRNYGSEEGGDLIGAANDARNMREVLLARWGFQAENVRMLLDTSATRGAVRSALTEWLPSVARPGDVVVFYFSGHGSQVLDADGDEPDGLDETLCPTDVMRNDGSRDIKDDELAGWLAALPTREVTVILDSCHSGTATRALAPFARRKALARSDPAPTPAGPPAQGAGDQAPGVLEISAAQAEQYAVETAWEEGGTTRHGGAFTTPLVRYLWQVPTSTPYQEVFRLTREEMRRANLAQTPRIAEVPLRDRAAFSPAQEPASAATTAPRVVSAQGAVVVLEGGASAGMQPGAVFTAGESWLRVQDVRGDRATAQVVRGPAPAVGAGASLVAITPRATVLRVSVAALPVAIVQQIQAQRLTGVVLQSNPNTPAHLVARQEGAGLVVTGPDGGLRGIVPAAQPAALGALLQNEAAAFALASLDNPAHPWAVDLGFADPRNSYRLGERVAFRVRSARPGYLTVVDVAPGGQVTILFPNAYDSANRVEAGQEVALPTAAMPFEFRVEEPLGRGVVRAFVTERPLQLDLAGAADPVEGLLSALRAAGAGAAGLEGALPLGSWATSYVVYEFTR